MLITRRALSRRLATLAARLGDSSDALTAKGGAEASLSRLERAADVVTTELADARVGRSRLEQAFGTVSQGVVVCDEQGDVVFHNDQALRILGEAPTEALAREAVVQHLQAAAQGRTESQTLELYGPPRRVLTISAEPLDDGSRNVGAVAVIEDVSERRRLEAVRRDFVANISHELKTPVGALALLAETVAGEADADVVNRLARRLHVESQRVARVVDDLLDLSRIESEEAPARDPVKIDLIVAQAAERIRPAAEHRSISVTVGEVPRQVAVLGDRRQLVSALFNLLENAVKYSDDGSEIDLGATAEEAWVEVQVIDRGIGIPARDLERIFERFYRVDRARARDTGGTGLGLAIVRHVIANHGGEVTVDSREGEGSRFALRLPLAPGSPRPQAAKAKTKTKAKTTVSVPYDDAPAEGVS
ncbi:MAG TPA: ATP-binding protein [Acidimicrobiales bacterium]|nr:ATP-binding protein [Acidimicrobiales bacterium]